MGSALSLEKKWHVHVETLSINSEMLSVIGHVLGFFPYLILNCMQLIFSSV